MGVSGPGSGHFANLQQGLQLIWITNSNLPPKSHQNPRCANMETFASKTTGHFWTGHFPNVQ